jgi:hypothetical protein
MAHRILNATEAVHIDVNSPTGNLEGVTPQLDVGEYNAGTDKRRSLIQFDFSSLPPGAVITAVTFQIYLSTSVLSDNNRTIRAYRLKRNWVENEVTWNSYSSGNSWVLMR